MEKVELSLEAQLARNLYHKMKRPKREAKKVSIYQKRFYEKLALEYKAKGLLQEAEVEK